MLTDLVLCICDNADTPYGVNETAASPKHRITPPSIEQTEDLRRMLEGQLSTAGAATSTISSLVTEPITHHNTSSGEPLKHFKPGTNLQSNSTIFLKVKFQLSLIVPLKYSATFYNCTEMSIFEVSIQENSCVHL